MKRKVKTTIDSIMLVLFIMLMGYHISGEAVHEWMGVVLGIVFVFHLVLNRKWLLGLMKGHYSYQRYLFLCINFLLIISCLITMVSGILISKNIGIVINIESTFLARKLHMFASTWTYVFMSMHLGLHLTWIENRKFHNKFMRKIRIFACISLPLYGSYVFVERRLFEDMLLLNDFKFLPYGENILYFITAYVALMTAGAAVGYVLLQKDKYLRLLKFRRFHEQTKEK